MRRTNSQPLKDVINDYLRALGIDTKIKEVRLIRNWEEVIGKTVAKSTQNIYIKNRILFVHLNSSIIRNELLMIKTGLIQALNNKAGENLIDDIILR